MPATITDILRTKPELITVTPDVPLVIALEEMMRYDYSQLPVVDAANRPMGILSSDSIVRALHHFNTTVRENKDADAQELQLRVRDALQRQIEVCSSEDEVFEVHRQLRDVSGVLVVDDDGKLIGIITGYDTTEYLRQRVQDIVFVQDIEETLKDYVRLAFRQGDGSDDGTQLTAAIAEMMPSNDNLSGAFKRAVSEYCKVVHSNPQINGSAADQAFRSKLYEKEAPKPFDKLALYQFITLFLKHGLARYGSIFQLDKQSIEQILASVCETRNDLSHLRIDITARQRDELRFCRQWLKHYYEAAQAFVTPAHDPLQPTATSPIVDESTNVDLDNATNAPVVPTQETVQPGESRYAALANWLYAQPPEYDRVKLTFQDIEQMLGAKLPPSAREYHSWWANDSSRSRPAEQWLSAGWRRDEVSLKNETVSFRRIQDYEQAYIAFFNELFADLKQELNVPLFAPTQTGYHWQSIARLPSYGTYAGYTTFSFTRARQPRADLYIDTGDGARNKRIFDVLYERRSEIETVFGGPLSWERLDEKRSSRIAMYYNRAATIHSDATELEQLRQWAVQVLTRLYHALEKPAREVMDVLAQASASEPIAAK